MTNKLLDGVLQGLANPENYRAVASGDLPAIKSRLRMGTSPIAMASDWFSNPLYDQELRLLALKGLVQQCRLSGIHPDDEMLASGSVSLLAAAAELGAFEEIVHLLSMGADPLQIVDPEARNPRARTIIGRAMTVSMTKPEVWLSYYTAFGNFAESYHYQLGHYRLKAELEEEAQPSHSTM